MKAYQMVDWLVVQKVAWKDDMMVGLMEQL